jgi:hypothetical protein
MQPLLLPLVVMAVLLLMLLELVEPVVLVETQLLPLCHQQFLALWAYLQVMVAPEAFPPLVGLPEVRLVLVVF